MKNTILKLITNALQQTLVNGDFSVDLRVPNFFVENPKDERHGDFYTNLALVIAPLVKMKPREIAEKIIQNINFESSHIAKVEVAGPGFINFFMTNCFWYDKLREAIEQGDKYGRTNFGNREKVLVEFVSANPTGPLHIGHGRGAVVGDVVAKTLDWAGYDVQKEYYINDVGLQMNTLGLSTFIRYKQFLGQKIELPDDSYKGKYIEDIANDILRVKGDCYRNATEEEAVPFFSDYSCRVILKEIKKDLNKFGISFDNWYSEKTLFEEAEENGEMNRVKEVIGYMIERGIVYEKEDALWLRASEFGDEKDRVVRRGTGVYTYFASDIAYHREKIKRGFQKIINVWGADHHGYVPRLRSALKAFDFPDAAFLPILIQLVNLKKGGEIISMSTRGGIFRRLSELIYDVGKDAARFFFLARSCEAQLDFDIDLARRQSSENPVYYVQYAHARICSVFRQAYEKNDFIPGQGSIDMNFLSHVEELLLIKRVLELPDLVNRMASRLEPHLITYYIQDLASEFHRYYNKYRIISSDIKVTKARLTLIKGVQIAIKNSLNILGVTAPETM